MRKTEDRRKLAEEEEVIGRKICRCTVGAIINYSIAVDFAAIFVTCIIVIGCIGSVQHDLNNGFSLTNHSDTLLCYMFSSCEPPTPSFCNFIPEYNAHTCEGSIFGFTVIAAMSLPFAISKIVKAILNHDLNWTLFIEIPVLVIMILMVFALSIMISIGNLVTCESIMTYYGSVTCDLAFPHPNSDNVFYHVGRADTARNSSWFVFTFLVVALVVYIVRLVIFIRRKRKQALQEVLDNEDN